MVDEKSYSLAGCCFSICVVNAVLNTGSTFSYTAPGLFWVKRRAFFG